jgi:hypothetical protein
LYVHHWGYPSRDIEREIAARRRAHLVSVRARLRLQQRVERLEDDLARLGLVAMALAKLCLDKGVVSPEELQAQMKEIDLADGVEDGKPAPGATEPDGGDQP